MSQFVLFVSCWFLVVARGSGLTGITPRDHETTTSIPHSPRPPPVTTTPPRPEKVVSNQNSSILMSSFKEIATKCLDCDDMEMSEPVRATHYSTSLPVTSTISSESASTSVKPSVPIIQDQASSSDKPLYNFFNLTTTKPPSTSSYSITKEQVRQVPQNSLREVSPLFVRRKHIGPYYSSRVNKLSKLLRPSKLLSPETIHPNLNKTNHHLMDVSLTSNSSSSNVLVNVTSSVKDPLKSSRTTQHPHSTALPLKEASTTRHAPTFRPRKRPISMGIPASSTIIQKVTITTTPTVQSYNPPDSDEYYSSYGEYPDLSVIGYNTSGYRESAVLPDPDSAPPDEESEAEVVLPDDSLADTDLHDHDLIDSVMYIYFGSSERDERGAGRQVLIVGAVISLVAQFLTLVSVIRRLRCRPDESASLILLNAELALTAANLVFMLGVQATGNKRRCELIAVTLHYFHLVACCWFLVNSVFSYLELQMSETRRRLRPWWVAAWCIPALVVLGCVAFNRRGYETRSFCWMSVARGMLYSFMVPVAVLILLNTCLTVLGLRQLSLSAKTEDCDRKAMRVSATLLPVFAVVWFLGVVALENSASLVFPLMFVASNGFLNWFVLACWLPADFSLWRDSEEDYDEEDDDLYEEVLKSHTDSQPLLDEPQVYVCGRRDLCELQMDPICTISS